MTVWVGIVDGRIIRPYILPPRLLGQTHLPARILGELFHDVSFYIRRAPLFQHDDRDR